MLDRRREVAARLVERAQVIEQPAGQQVVAGFLAQRQCRAEVRLGAGVFLLQQRQQALAAQHGRPTGGRQVDPAALDADQQLAALVRAAVEPGALKAPRPAAETVVAVRRDGQAVVLDPMDDGGRRPRSHIGHSSSLLTSSTNAPGVSSTRPAMTSSNSSLNPG